ncbi:TadE/TadG family type IV pilus assembly protein [Sphingomonas sp. CFBP 13720]|uniref:TadE/TadG family type IV pilus assembly protein n=1 Tax=Sphingomonas sp. CFBP 13720 TaxID=2775302 RepID=UPI00177C05F5|nr:TadE/TadG family type IV pilus assembly protein [Sphingomonas sp. CFBP 13720]MBD8678479.1 TadE/TadG family protein [Sphingomonas sp. CFBP 13720]
MAKAKASARKSFVRFLRNERGNALMIMAFAMFPLLAAIGSGLDIGRAQMARAKLQQAVDAAALAGRRVMTGDNIETAKPEVATYMAFNFPGGLYGTAPVTITTTKPDVGAVKVVATTSIPTSVMGMFGYRRIELAATGTAVQTFKNVDIMLVLDTTGSMLDPINGTRKIDALKTAVKALYDQLAPAQSLLKAKGLRMRFGIVPYAATANVGKLLYAKNPSYIRSANATYYQWNKSSRGSWSFAQRTYNLSNFVAGGALGNINGNNDDYAARWDGCVEERRTDPGITAKDVRDAAPASAIDLDIDRIPDGTDDTRFQAYLFDPHTGVDIADDGVNSYCPTRATELTEMTAADMTGLLAKLEARGSTYHDVGMIWGTRLISNGGIWGPGNPDTFNQIGVQRYIVYMTDGTISAPRDSCYYSNCYPTSYDRSFAYSGYGIEAYDRRAGATSDTDNDGRHTKRFLMACNAAKAKGISIWTIAFGTGRVPSLDTCASSADQSAVAANSNDLIAKFATIGKSIGSLRLSD